MTNLMNSYWNARYTSGRIWGDDACASAFLAGDWFRRQRGMDILVPGCGYGRNSLCFASQGFRVTAYDVSDTAIKLAEEQSREKLLDIEYIVGDIFDDNILTGRTFESIYLSNVLHLFLAEDRKRLIERMTLMLKPKGLFTFSCISIFDTNNYGIGPEIEPNTFEKHEGKPLHFFSEEEIRQILASEYQVLECKLHPQTESDPSGDSEDLQLWFVAAKKL
jgi:2-polyprenyl-3-methyl-5-hydroxy-6-metoxy-1,4-benzoquinol methylase